MGELAHVKKYYIISFLKVHVKQFEERNSKLLQFDGTQDRNRESNQSQDSKKSTSKSSNNH